MVAVQWVEQDFGYQRKTVICWYTFRTVSSLMPELIELKRFTAAVKYVLLRLLLLLHRPAAEAALLLLLLGITYLMRFYSSGGR